MNFGIFNLMTLRDPAKSRRFYELALAPLGYQILREVPTQFTGGKVVLGFGVPPKPDFWINEGTPQTPRVHLAFRAENRAQVDAFYAAAIAGPRAGKLAGVARTFVVMNAAAAVGIMLPIVAFMMALQRHLVRGIALGAVKG